MGIGGVGKKTLNPFIIFYRNQVGNCDMDQLQNCNIQSTYGIHVQKTLNKHSQQVFFGTFRCSGCPHNKVCCPEGVAPRVVFPNLRRTPKYGNLSLKTQIRQISYRIQIHYSPPIIFAQIENHPS